MPGDRQRQGPAFRQAGCLAVVSVVVVDSVAASGMIVLEIPGLSTAWPPGVKTQ